STTPLTPPPPLLASAPAQAPRPNEAAVGPQGLLPNRKAAGLGPPGRPLRARARDPHDHLGSGPVASGRTRMQSPTHTTAIEPVASPDAAAVSNREYLCRPRIGGRPAFAAADATAGGRRP